MNLGKHIIMDMYGIDIEKMKNIDIFVKSYDVDVLKREFDKYWKGYTT